MVAVTMTVTDGMGFERPMQSPEAQALRQQHGVIPTILFFRTVS